jgi:heat shock protein 4
VLEKHQKEHAAKQAELERAKREAEAKQQANAPPTEDAKDTEMTDAETTKPDGVEEAS